ncbi:uncharacterized protein LOC108090226 [Drosophila ficusphila]|uniref:uncharacterized protein LOC108090226 n=1 Tax=Drosophila ficusphila TaxID=30025 RepID=UPI001C89DC56|nr:uncharacterized protein LOC108090226 [Drosophila ficusphila]
MDAHSTAVAIADMQLDWKWNVDEPRDECDGSEAGGWGEDLRAKMRRLQDDHVWIRQQMTHLQRRLVTRQLERQRRLYEAREHLQQLLRALQVKYGRNWGL